MPEDELFFGPYGCESPIPVCGWVGWLLRR
jgi:hypothetical protein